MYQQIFRLNQQLCYEKGTIPCFGPAWSIWITTNIADHIEENPAHMEKEIRK
jgi:hypothetical protein